MPEKSFVEAMVDALSQSLAADPRVTCIGSGLVTGRGLTPQASKAFFAKFASRLIDPPVSESAVTSVAAGAAMAGLRPFVDFGTAAFAFEAVNQLVNEVGNAHYMSGGQLKAPVVYHMLHGIRGRGGPQHSASPQAMYANCAGLQIALPASPADAQGLLRSALTGDNPVLFITHTKLLNMRGEVPEGDFTIPLGQAAIKRTGRDVTVVATSLMVHTALEAAQLLAGEGIEVEVVDPRTVVPLDREAICASVRKTSRLVTVDEANRTCSIASEIAAMVAEEAFDALKAPVLRVARPDVPVGYSPPLEERVTVTPDRIAAAIRQLMPFNIR